MNSHLLKPFAASSSRTLMAGAANDWRPSAFGTASQPLEVVPQEPPRAQVAPVPRRARHSVSDFERRFLGAADREGRRALEVATLWRDVLVSVDVLRPTRAGRGAAVGASDCVLEAVVGVDDCRLLLAASAEARVVRPGAGVGDRVLSLAAAIEAGVARQLGDRVEVVLDSGTRLRVEAGEQLFLFRYVAQETAAWPLFAGASVAGAGLAFLLSLVFHGFLGSLVAYSTEQGVVMELDQLSSASRFGAALFVPAEEEEPETTRSSEPSASEASSDAAGEAGRAGAPESTAADAGMARRGGGAETVPGHGRLAVRSAGLLAEQDALESMLALNLDSGGHDAMDAWGRFDLSPAMADAPGSYGLNATGPGRSAGGSDPSGIVGPARFSTVGRFNPNGRGGPGEAGDVLGECESCGKTRPEVKVGPITASGSLDKRLIRKVVKQHARELKACYQRELQQKSGLTGRLEVKWFIDATGNVSSAFLLGSTMKNATVEQCVLGSIAHWRFPAPRDGGMVAVQYPFVFEPSR